MKKLSKYMKSVVSKIKSLISTIKSKVCPAPVTVVKVKSKKNSKKK